MGFSSAFICLPRVNNYSVQDAVKFSKSEKKPENKTLWSDIKKLEVFWYLAGVSCILICAHCSDLLSGHKWAGPGPFSTSSWDFTEFSAQYLGKPSSSSSALPWAGEPRASFSQEIWDLCCVRDTNWPVHCWWCLFIVCSFACFLLSFHPALRIHNFTVLAPHTSAFVNTNDSAYSNSSATVGEDLLVFCSAFLRRGWFL